ncbi:MAG: glycosyl transferase [Candidatus Binatia bacterium]|nr:MAG: glycosyl transferase [Candidatus Binatia bacterium]
MAEAGRITLFLSALSGGGAQRRMVTLANGFAASGYAVDLVPAVGEGTFAKELREEVRVLPLDALPSRLAAARRKKGLSVLAAVPSLAAYLRREQPAVVLSTSNPANVAVLLARELVRPRIPVAISVNVFLSVALRARGRGLLRRLVLATYPRADRMLAISSAVARNLAELFPNCREKLRTVYVPVDVARIQALAETEPEHPWFEEGGPPVVLAVGKLKPQKDFPTLLRAFARVGRPARLLVLGEGDLRDSLLRLAEDLGIASRTSFPGFVENPFPFFARASVFVSTSLWEGFGNAVAEALACGCPVVATDCPGGTRELLDDGRYGVLVPVGDAAAVARAVESVLDAPPDRAALRARAREFAPERIVPRYLEVLREIRRAAAFSELEAR